MVAQLLGLKLKILTNGFRRRPGQVLGFVIALIVGLGVAIAASVGLLALREADVETARGIVVVAGSLVVAGFLLIPLVFGADDVVDPRKFSAFGIPISKLAIGLACTGFISVPAIAVTLVSFTQVATWNRNTTAVFTALFCAFLLVATCVLAARVSTVIAALLLASRRARELTGLGNFLVLGAVVPILALIVTTDWEKDGAPLLSRIADTVAFTPLGAAWAAPAYAAVGNTAGTVATLAIALGFLLVLWLVWRVLVGKALAKQEGTIQARTDHGLGWFSYLPATEIGAVAARSLSYWGRDSRYRSAIAIIPIIPIVMIGVLLVAGTPLNVLLLLPVPVVCLFLAWGTLHNDVALDNTAIWLHVASRVPGRADRAGRIAPPLVIGLLVMAIGIPLSVWGFGSANILPSLIGVSVCVLFAGLGLASIASALVPYPAVHPGDSPFAQPQSSSSGAAWAQGLSLVGVILLSAPTIILAVLGIVFGGGWHVAALLIGVASGVAVLIGGIQVGGRVFDSRGPELLSFTERY